MAGAPVLLIAVLAGLLTALTALSPPAMPFDAESGRELLQAERLRSSPERDPALSRAGDPGNLPGQFSPYTPPLAAPIDGRIFATRPPTWAALLALAGGLAGPWGMAALPVLAALWCVLLVRRLARQTGTPESLSLLLAAGSPLLFYALTPSPAVAVAALVTSCASLLLEIDSGPRAAFAGAVLGLAGWLEPTCLPAVLAGMGGLAAEGSSRRRIPAFLGGWLVAVGVGLLAVKLAGGGAGSWQAGLVAWLSPGSGLTGADGLASASGLTLLGAGLSRIGAAASSPAVSLVLVLPALALLVRGAWAARRWRPHAASQDSTPVPQPSLTRTLLRPRGLTVNALLAWLIASSFVLVSLILEPDPIDALAHFHGLLPLTPWLALTLFGLVSGHEPGQDAIQARAIRRLFVFAALLLFALVLWPDPASSLPRWSQPRLLAALPLLAPLAARGIGRLWARSAGGPSPLLRPLLAGIIACSLVLQGYGLLLEHRGERAAEQVADAVRGLEPGVPLVTPLSWYAWQAAPATAHRAVYRVTERNGLELWLASAWASGVRRWVWASDLPDELFLAGLPLHVIRRQEVDVRGHSSLSHHLVVLEMLEPEGPVARETWAKLAARAARRLQEQGRREEASQLLRKGIPLTQEGPLREAMERMAGNGS